MTKGRWTLAVLLGFDLITKLLALTLLPTSQSVDPDALVQVVLRTNSLGIGTWGQTLSADSGLADRAAAGLGMAAVGIVLVSTRGSSRLRRVLTVLGFYFTVSIFAGLWLRRIETIPMPVGVGLMRLGGATLLASIWWLTPPGWWRLASALLAASAIGNFASVLLPPHEIVDFLYSRLVARCLGWGVFNAADLYYLAGGLVLAMAIMRALVRRIRARLERQTV